MIRKNKIEKLLVFAVIVISCLNITSAQNKGEYILFDVFLEGINETFEWDYYQHGEVEVPLLEKKFLSFKSEIVDIRTSFSFGDSSDYKGEYMFIAQLLDSDRNVIQEKEIGLDLFILSNPVTELDANLVSVAFNETYNSKYIRVLYNNSIILEQEFRSLLCNFNQICENPYIDNESLMFENYLSCPDCSYFDEDGICNSKKDVKYYFLDNFCDKDCILDLNETDGDCFKESCNDGIQNQDETGVDCGGECLACGCNDYDGEFLFKDSLFVKANIEDKDSYYIDKCINENVVREYYCGWDIGWDFWNIKKIIKQTDRECKAGCFEGRCLEFEPEIPGFVEKCDNAFDNSMIGYWKFDGDYKDSYNGNNTSPSYTSFVDGKVNQAVKFDGRGTMYLGKLGLDMEEVSMALWIKTNINNATIGNRINYGSYGPWFTLFANSLELGDYYNHIRVNFNKNTLDNQWHHIVYTKNEIYHKIYVDGNLTKSFTRDVNMAGREGIYLGVRDAASGMDWNRFHHYGLMDELVIFDKALSEQEVASMYEKSLAGLHYCFGICGNNILEAGEECDDGNTIDLDGCSSKCIIEVIDCIDYDKDTLENGIYVKSKVEVEGDVYEDYCDNGNLIENICVDDLIGVVNYSCSDYNAICEDGKCVDLPPEPETL